MVAHPAEYPWSSYRANALGHTDSCITPHGMYWALGSDDVQRQVAYRQLFKGRLSEYTLTQIRDATNKAWVLGSDYFKQKVEAQLNRRADKLTKGGDKKSQHYQKNKINRV